MAQLVSLKNKQCLSAPGPYGAAMKTAICDNNDAKQKIQISNWDSSDKVQWSTNNAKIDTWQGVLYNSNECGRGNDCDFLFNNTVGNVGVGKGPFRVRGWGAGDNWAYPDANGMIVQNSNSPVSTDTWWLTLDEKNDCEAHGIPLYQCTPQNRQNCSAYNNYLRDSCKPSQCSTTKNIGDPVCQAYCVKSPGECDTAVVEYCAANPTDTGFCGCYNLQKYQNIIKSLGANSLAWNPRCNAQECLTPGAYQTKNMVNTTCSPQQICLSNLNINATETQVNSIVQQCAQQSSSGGSGVPLSSAASNTLNNNTSSTSTSPSASTTGDTQLAIGLGVGGFCLVLSCCALVLYARGRRN